MEKVPRFCPTGGPGSAVPLSKRTPDAVVCDSGSKTPKLVRYWHDRKTDPLGSDAEGEAKRVGRLRLSYQEVGELKGIKCGVYSSVGEIPPQMSSFRTHNRADSFSSGPF